MGHWWSKIRAFISKQSSSDTGAKTESIPAPWIGAEASPFGYPVLHLGAITGGMISTSKDPHCAEMAISWGNSFGKEFDPFALDALAALPCERRFPAADPLPDGLLFAPRTMEEKWVLAYRQGRIIAARSWSGTICAVAETRREGETLVVHSLRVAEASGLSVYGDVVDLFDWLMRTHALGQDLPMPMDEDGAALAEAVPLSVFSVFGSKAVYAAKQWTPTDPPRPLRSSGEMLNAVRSQDRDRAQALRKRGEPVDATCPPIGYTPLFFAVMAKDAAMVQALLQWGANPSLRGDDGVCPLIMGILHQAPQPILETLVAAGANIRHINKDGFGCLHAAAEVDNHAVVPWLLASGLDIAAPTHRGHTAVHIAAGLGHLKTLKVLLAQGANPLAVSPNGTALDIAKKAGHREIVDYLAGIAGKG
jgi:hypothetical protein